MAAAKEAKTEPTELEKLKAMKEWIDADPELSAIIARAEADRCFGASPKYHQLVTEAETLRTALKNAEATAHLNQLALNTYRQEGEWARSTPGAALARALSKAQAAISNIGKDREVEVQARDQSKRGYKFKYATLAAIMDVVRKPLTDNGLSISQFPTFDFKGAESTVTVETVLMHASGEKISNKITLPCLERDPQKVGIVLSYARRYGITALLGLAQTDEVDLDDLGVLDGMEAPPPMDAPKTPGPGLQQPPKHAGPKVKFIDLGLALQTAETEEQLDAAAAVVAAAKDRGELTRQQTEDLGRVYSATKKQLKAPKAAPAPAPEPGSEG